MNELDEILIRSSLPDLQAIPGVTLLGDWRLAGNSKVWMLRLRLELIGAEPTSDVPLHTEWQLVVDFNDDHWGEVKIYPASGDAGLSVTFPHQTFNGSEHVSLSQCRSGNLCTDAAFDAMAANRNMQPEQPEMTTARIIWHVQRAQELISRGINGTLAPNGAPFEQPDYRIGKNALGGRLAYYEDDLSFKNWQTQRQHYGLVELIVFSGSGNKDRSGTLAVKRFLDVTGRNEFYKPDWGNVMTTSSKGINGVWIRLKEIPVINKWQVPTTVGELNKLLEKQSLPSLSNILKEMLKALEGDTNGFIILIGYPIPENIGEPDTRYHWQSLSLLGPCRSKVKEAQWSQLAKVQADKDGSKLKWLPLAENWHPDDLQNRGRLPYKLRDANVILLGAGALGSVLAEQLVRMGLNNLTIVDGDRMEPGNLVRHILDMDDIDKHKATALAARLSKCNPSLKVEAIEAKFPMQGNEQFLKAAKEATLILDVTASNSVLQALPMAVFKDDAVFVSLSLGLNADYLFFYAASQVTFRWEEFKKWFAPYSEKQGQLARQMKLPRGAGCWHPLVPAPLNRIAGLAGIAVECLGQVLNANLQQPIHKVFDWPTISVHP